MHSDFGVHLDLRPRHTRHETVIVEREYGSSEASADSAEIFVYPRQGQSVAERDQDRYECHLWARAQTGFDPSRANQDQDMAPDYQRAISACLEGRGYTVK